MQADGGLVQHEERVHQRGAQGRGEVDALHLAAGEGAGLAVQGQVAQAHFFKVAQPGADFREQQVGRLVQRRRQVQPREELAAARDGQQHQVVHGQAGQGLELRLAPTGAARHEPPGCSVRPEPVEGRSRCDGLSTNGLFTEHATRVLLRAQPPQQRVGLEPRARAGRAGRVGAIAGEQHADVHLVALRFQPVEEAAHPVPLAVLPGPLALQHPRALLPGQFPPRHIHGDATLPGEAHQVRLALPVGLRLERLDGAAAQALRFVGNDQAVVDADGAAEAAAGLAGADGGIEREVAWRRFLVMDVAVGAVQVVAEAPDGSRTRIRGHMDIHPPPSHPQRRLQRLDHPRALGRAHAQPVLHDLDHPIAPGVDARVALGLQQPQHFLLAEVVRDGHREGDEQPRIARRLGAFGQFSEDRVRRVPPHRPAAAAAEELRRTGVEQLQVVVQLRHRAHGGARSAHRVGLVDGDGRRYALDALHLRAVLAVEELPRVGREGFHVAALALGIEGVEDQGGLARAGHARDHDQLVGRDVEVQVLQVVLPGAADADGALGLGVGHGQSSWRRGGEF